MTPTPADFSDPLVGALLGDRYTILRKLGEGGFGSIYLGRDERLDGRLVVAKLLLRTASPDAWREKSFRNEIAALARIDHPGVVGVLDTGQLANGTPYLIMQFVDGVTLRSMISGQGLPFDRVADMLQSIGVAVGAAHRAVIVHRDLKPANIMVQRLGQRDFVRVIDFGLAGLRPRVGEEVKHSGVVAGTMPYMSPEQLDGKPAAKGHDIYSLGVIAFELLTGKLPLESENAAQHRLLQLQEHYKDPLALRPDLPVAAVTLLRKTLSNDSDKRPQNAEEFGETLAAVLRSSRLSACEEGGIAMAYVLSVHIVDYSLLSMQDQFRAIERLCAAVARNPTFLRERNDDEVVGLPAGEGMVILFTRDCLAPAVCATELAAALGEGPAVRMGLHAGPVLRIDDVEKSRTTARDGITVAQRVMECGDAGHILVSRSMADLLRANEPWRHSLQYWGEMPVKDGQKIPIYNLVGPAFGRHQRSAKARRSQLTRRTAVLGVCGGIAASIPLLYTHCWPPERLRYSIKVQPMREGKATGPVFSLGPGAALPAGCRMRLVLRPTQRGFLHVLNQPPPNASSGSEFIWVYPGPKAGDAALKALDYMTIPQQDWLALDDDNGEEKLWLVWSDRVVAELEPIRLRVLKQMEPRIADPSEIRFVRSVLSHQAQAHQEGDEVVIRGGTLLSHGVRLYHY